MNKVSVVIFFGVMFFIISIGLGYYAYQISSLDKGIIENIPIAVEKIEDECTEETKSLKIENEIMASNELERKVSPNAAVVIKKYYIDCEHTTKDYTEIPKELVNLNENEVLAYYKDWTLKGFSNNEIVLYKEIEGSCNEHYILKSEEGRVNIYTIDGKGNENLKERTQISTDYLPEEDLEKLKAGVNLFGKENLNAAIEDFE